jgi:membrane protease subunit (stomatin/prohibitin family)
MGLIKAAIEATSSVLSDQWKDYFYCESLDNDVLVTKGINKRSRGDNNIITSGSGIAVADGQAMFIIEDGKIVEGSGEPGVFTYDASTEPTIFQGDLKESIIETFKLIGKRFSYGGSAAHDQRVYYFNKKEINGNRYGTPSPVPFRVVDKNIGLDIDISIRCHGEYSYKITDPILFYTNVCGNVSDEFRKEEIDSQLKSELMTALQPAFAKLSELGIRYSALPGQTMKLAEVLNEILSDKWGELRGIEVYSFGVSSVTASKEDEKMIKELQRNAVFQNKNLAAAHLVGAQAQAMQDAAKNESGAMMGFAGMNMAQGSGGANAQGLFSMGEKEQNVKVDKDTWKCHCGTDNTGKFCNNCGSPKPVTDKWACSCGTSNTGKFCSNCGNPKPVVKTYKCDKCGWEIKNPNTAPKFCPECGNPFK